jgi:hypothetical protein
VLDDGHDRRGGACAADRGPRLAVPDLAVVELDLDQRRVEGRDPAEVRDVLRRLGDGAAEPGRADVADADLGPPGIIENRSSTASERPERELD